MNETSALPINYITCCSDSLFLFIVIVIVALYLTLLLKMFIYSELYRHSAQCLPIMYFFGQKNSCKQHITQLTRLGYVPKTPVGVESYVDFSRSDAPLSQTITTFTNHYTKRFTDWLTAFTQEMGIYGFQEGSD